LARQVGATFFQLDRIKPSFAKEEVTFSPMHLELLIQAGLTPTQAEVLGYLFTQKELKAKEIVGALQKPRGVVYKGLEELIELGLVEKIEKTGAITRFRADHPGKLEALFENKEKSARLEREAFISVLPELTSQFNLTHQKPGMRFYEGEAGQQHMLAELQHCKTEVCVFIDQKTLREAAQTLITKLKNTRPRGGAGKKRKILVVGSKPENGKESKAQDGMLEIRYLIGTKSPFKSSVRIYDNKLAYQIEENGNIITMVVEDKNIFEMNKTWFDYLWETADAD
jgi:sugar-specific transcriptional regulator TrmB